MVVNVLQLQLSINIYLFAFNFLNVTYFITPTFSILFKQFWIKFYIKKIKCSVYHTWCDQRVVSSTVMSLGGHKIKAKTLNHIVPKKMYLQTIISLLFNVTFSPLSLQEIEAIHDGHIYHWFIGNICIFNYDQKRVFPTVSRQSKFWLVDLANHHLSWYSNF